MDNLEKFLSEVHSLSDEGILAELSELSDMSEEQLLSELESKGHNEDQLTQAVRMMAELDTESLENALA